jgi:putative transposase
MLCGAQRFARQPGQTGRGLAVVEPPAPGFKDPAQRAILTAWPVAEPADWVRRVNQAQTEAELKALRGSVMRGRPFGSDLWAGRTAKRLGLEYTLRPRGRPRKKGKGSGEPG